MTESGDPKWSQCSTDDGSVYYFEQNSQESSWEKPQQIIDLETETPQGWELLWTADGQKYYHNKLTNDTSWHKPTSSVEPSLTVHTAITGEGKEQGGSGKLTRVLRTESTEMNWRNIDDMMEQLSRKKEVNTTGKVQEVFSSQDDSDDPLRRRAVTLSSKIRHVPPSKPLPVPDKPLPTPPGNTPTQKEDSVPLNEPRLGSIQRSRSATEKPVTYSVDLSSDELGQLKKLSHTTKDDTKFTASDVLKHKLKGFRKKNGSIGHGGGQQALKEMAAQFEKDAASEAEQWDSEVTAEQSWGQVAIDPDVTHALIDMECRKTGFNLEFGKEGQSLESSFYVEDSINEKDFFREVLMNTGHDHFVGEDKIFGPVVVTIEAKEKGLGAINQKILRCLLRTRKGDQRLSIIGRVDKPLPDSADSKLKALKEIAPEYNMTKFLPVREPSDELDSNLLAFEKQQKVKAFKFGILYVKGSQKTENEFFSNVDTSTEFNHFLDCIAEKVELKGFTGFSGGLDTKRDSTGTHSYYAEHQGCEIMFHVAPLLPFFPKDEQQVERKRHLGNDVVVLVFKEDPQSSFPAHSISSHFNHVFAVVQPENGGYRIAFANKPGVKPYDPPLPSPPVFERGPTLKNFLLTKLINAELAAMVAPDFKQKLSKTRGVYLKNIVDTYGTAVSNRTKLLKTMESVKKMTSPKKKEGMLEKHMSMMFDSKAKRESNECDSDRDQQ